MVQSAYQQNGRPKRKSGEMTAQGRRSQIQHKLGHGIRGISPVLLEVERQSDWESHYEGVCRALNPANEFEADLVYLIAWQLWHFGRLIRHETALTNEKIHKAPESIFDVGNNPTVTKKAILDAIAQLECERQNGDSCNGASSKKAKADSNNGLLSRCRAMESGAPNVMFDPSEVREILGLVLEQVRSSGEEEINGDDGYGEADNDEPI
jgi:hypothetical protein